MWEVTVETGVQECVVKVGSFTFPFLKSLCLHTHTTTHMIIIVSALSIRMHGLMYVTLQYLSHPP